MRSFVILSIGILLLFMPNVRGQGQNLSSQEDYTCSPTKSCKIGCCGGAGYCGFGPDFCGDNCVEDCNRKSECDPGWGARWSNASSCPLKVCCSQYGFCGTTKDFCGDKVVQQPSCSSKGNTAKQRVVGYYEAWNIQRCCDQRFPQDIYMGPWTHLNFAFAYIDPSTFDVVPMDSRDEQLYEKFTGLKTRYPSLKTWISVGGWAMNDPGPYNATFSNLAASSYAMSLFSTSLIKFMDRYGFDGVDIDWEYPVAEERAGRPADLRNFVTWLTQLRGALGNKYGLTITIPSSYWYMRHFDISGLVNLVDWFNIMTYDLHGTWDGTNPYVGRYINSHTNVTEIDQALDLLWRNDIPPDKVAMGLGFYGRSFTLEDPSCSKAGCRWSEGGRPGACTKNSGTLSFAEIDEVIHNNNPVITYDTKAMVNEIVWDQNQWVSHDDVRAFVDKYAYANSRCLGGLLVWAITLDTPEGQAHKDLCTALQCTTYRQGYQEPPCSCGSSGQCRRWHTVYEGDTCYDIYTNAGLTFEQLRALNPQLDSSCSNLRLGYQYCTSGDPAPPDLTTCQPGEYYGSSTSTSTTTTTTTTTTVSATSSSTNSTPSYNADIPSGYPLESSSSSSTTSDGSYPVTIPPVSLRTTTSSSESTSSTSTLSSTPSSSTSSSGSDTSTSTTDRTYVVSTPATSSSFTDSTYPVSTSSESKSSDSSTTASTSDQVYSTTESSSQTTTTTTFTISSYEYETTPSRSTTSTTSTAGSDTAWTSSSSRPYSYETYDTPSGSTTTTLSESTGTPTTVGSSSRTFPYDTYDLSSSSSSTTSISDTSSRTMPYPTYDWSFSTRSTTSSSTCSASPKLTKWISVGCPETRYREL